MKVQLDDVIVHKGVKKSDGKSYYYVEVLEPVRKFISPAQPQDSATLEALADSAQRQTFSLDLVGQNLRFSSADLH